MDLTYIFIFIHYCVNVAIYRSKMVNKIHPHLASSLMSQFATNIAKYLIATYNYLCIMPVNIS